jgi:hypothetical protein
MDQSSKIAILNLTFANRNLTVADALLVGKEIISWSCTIKELMYISDTVIEDFKKEILKYGEEQKKKASDVGSMGSSDEIQVVHL